MPIVSRTLSTGALNGLLPHDEIAAALTDRYLRILGVSSTGGTEPGSTHTTRRSFCGVTARRPRGCRARGLGTRLAIGVGLAVLAVLLRSRDIVWFWCLHFVMDMTQFEWVRQGGP